jgi:predicted glycosyltransferase
VSACWSTALTDDRPHVLFYCQHSLGLGHLVRAWAIAGALSASFDVTLACGGPIPDGVAPPSTFRTIELPAIVMGEGRRLEAAAAGDGLAAAIATRRDILLRLFADLQPSVIVIELFPFGRKKFAGEIVPLLETARTRTPRPLVVCSVRDILVGRGAGQQKHDDRARALADALFDAILVHADPNVVRFDESFHPTEPLKVPLYYTGFVTRDADCTGSDARGRRVVVSAGGGRVGEALLRAAIAAHRHLWTAERLETLAITGPYFPDAAYLAVESAARGLEGFRVIRAVPDVLPELRRSAASVSQCGYNTAMEILCARVPALVIPFAESGEDEQTVRARWLERAGLARVMMPGDVSGETLAEQIRQTVRFLPSPHQIDLNGAENTVRRIAELLATAGDIAGGSR